MGIAATTKDLELACRYLDYWYTPEVMMLGTMGVEGETYVVDDDGTYHLSDQMKDMVSSGKVNTASEAVFTQSIGTADFGLYNWGMFDSIYEGNKATDAYDRCIELKQAALDRYNAR
ncbi:MAG: hypothetical protein K6E70_11100 [Butyrivibrio sp.]|nr:hypothetical protein [Butyrivibrio sp.]